MTPGPLTCPQNPLLTRPHSPRWLDRPDGYRCFEAAYFVGRGRTTFEACAEDLLQWKVKTRSGFDIEPAGRRVEAGQEPTIRVRLGPFRLPDPSRVLEVVETEDLRGFTYGTKPGHPITGEESFLLVHPPDDRVFLVLRSVSRAGLGIWRLGEPVVRLAQRVYRRRYSRALRGNANGLARRPLPRGGSESKVSRISHRIRLLGTDGRVPRGGSSQTGVTCP